jgi:hypothetical protein
MECSLKYLQDMREFNCESGKCSPCSVETGSPAFRLMAETPAEGDRVGFSLLYLGKVDEPQPLGSGEIRYQFGLRIRCPNTCNAIYVMCRLLDDGLRLVASWKHNPGKEEHSECRDGGYSPLGDLMIPEPMIENATLIVEIVEAKLNIRVFLDDKEERRELSVDLPPEAAAQQGSWGIRTDNIKCVITPFTWTS